MLKRKHPIRSMTTGSEIDANNMFEKALNETLPSSSQRVELSQSSTLTPSSKTSEKGNTVPKLSKRKHPVPSKKFLSSKTSRSNAPQPGVGESKHIASINGQSNIIQSNAVQPIYGQSNIVPFSVPSNGPSNISTSNPSNSVQPIYGPSTIVPSIYDPSNIGVSSIGPSNIVSSNSSNAVQPNYGPSSSTSLSVSAIRNVSSTVPGYDGFQERSNVTRPESTFDSIMHSFIDEQFDRNPFIEAVLGQQFIPESNASYQSLSSEKSLEKNGEYRISHPLNQYEF